MRSKACALINQHKPLFIRGSPPCTAFCRCQPLNVARYDWSEQGMRRRMAEGEVHLRVCCKIHRAQLQAGKHFLHEQPATAMSWALPEMQNLFEDGRLQRLVGDQCQLGQQTDRGQCMEKSTGWMSDSPVILRQLEKRCIGRGGECNRPGSGRYVTASGKVAWEAAVYPFRVCHAILRSCVEQMCVDGKLTRGSQGLQACHEEDSETLDMVMQLVEDTNVMEIETVNALVKSAAAKDKQK